MFVDTVEPFVLVIGLNGGCLCLFTVELLSINQVLK